VKQGAVAQTARVKLASASLFNDVLCEYFPRKLALLTRKLGPAGNDGLPSAIECGNQGANGVRSKCARVYMIVEEVAHFTPSPLRETLCCSCFGGLASAIDRAAAWPLRYIVSGGGFLSVPEIGVPPPEPLKEGALLKEGPAKGGAC
jgi:hypothetical protein